MKKLFIILFIAWAILPLLTFAQTDDVVFKAKVVEVVNEKEVQVVDGTFLKQQDLKLQGLENEYKNRDFFVNGISDLVMLQQGYYKVGDKVVVMSSTDSQGQETFYIVDYVRQSPLIWLTIIFFTVVLLVARIKGLRALIVLLITFFVIIKAIVPLLLSGYNPLLISILGALFISFLAIFGTDGFNKKTLTSFVTILISLFFIFLFSWIFTTYTHLTGATEESVMLLGMGFGNLNLQGLLLAGIVLGAIGVMDDVIINQVSLVKEIISLNPQQHNRRIYKQAMLIGIDHINAMINTLFLAYAGAALPLLILFSINQAPFVSFSHVVNNELVATEIVRTLTGSIVLVLSVPLATYLAIKIFKAK